MLTARVLFDLLYKEMGPQGWWPADSEIEILIGAILVQNTNWRNVEKSLENISRETDFKAECLTALSSTELEALIRPSGFHKNKAKAIHGILVWLAAFDYDYSMIDCHFGESLRKELLKLHGVGPETADVLLVYLFNRVEFIPDSYTRRLYKRLGFNHTDSYNHFKHEVSIDDFTNEEAKEFHGLLDEFGKRYLTGKNTNDNHFLTDYFKN